MSNLPGKLKLTRHAQQRLKERKKTDIYYDTKNLVRSSCKWYTKDDLIKDSNLYLHCLYVCRKSSQMCWITNGEVEALYNKGAGVVITIMNVKDKFLPITKYIKPERLEQMSRKKTNNEWQDFKIGYCLATENNEDTYQELYAAV